MDALRADLASETLRQGAHAGLGARKSTEQRLSADRPRGAGKENGAGTARNHAPCGFAPGQEGAERMLAPQLFEMGNFQIAEGIAAVGAGIRLEEHTSELQSLMRISYAVFCLKKTK